MTRIFFILAIVVIAFSLIGCDIKKVVVDTVTAKQVTITITVVSESKKDSNNQTYWVVNGSYFTRQSLTARQGMHDGVYNCTETGISTNADPLIGNMKELSSCTRPTPTPSTPKKQ
jgi:hypothetical protein